MAEESPWASAGWREAEAAAQELENRAAELRQQGRQNKEDSMRDCGEVSHRQRQSQNSQSGHAHEVLGRDETPTEDQVKRMKEKVRKYCWQPTSRTVKHKVGRLKGSPAYLSN